MPFWRRKAIVSGILTPVVLFQDFADGRPQSAKPADRIGVVLFGRDWSRISIGRSVLEKAFVNSVKAIEVRNAPMKAQDAAGRMSAPLSAGM